jgi:hypothetical protein
MRIQALKISGSGRAASISPFQPRSRSSARPARADGGTVRRTSGSNSRAASDTWSAWIAAKLSRSCRSLASSSSPMRAARNGKAHSLVRKYG